MYFSSFDIFSYNYKFSYNNQGGYKTNIGAFFSIIIYLVLSLITIVFIEQWWNQTNKSISFYSTSNKENKIQQCWCF